MYDPTQATFDLEAQQIVDNNPDAYVVIDYPDTSRQGRRCACPHRQVRPQQAGRSRRARLLDRSSNIPPQALEGARGTRGGADSSTQAYKLFDDLWQKAAGSSISRSTQTASIRRPLRSSLRLRPSPPIPPQSRGRSIRVTKPGAAKYSPTNSGDALKAVWAGEPIDYVGVAGAFSSSHGTGRPDDQPLRHLRISQTASSTSSNRLTPLSDSVGSVSLVGMERRFPFLTPANAACSRPAHTQCSFS